VVVSQPSKLVTRVRFPYSAPLKNEKLMSLLQFVEEYPVRTDKYPLGYIHHFYDQFLTPKKESAQKILEIGIYRGQSIILWRDYFSNATVYGLDLNICDFLWGKERVQQIITDAYANDFIDLLQDNYFDIIIDDGPHTYASMEIFLTKYFDKLKSGGVMVLEDIINPNWTPKLLELIDKSLCNVTVVNMAGKQLDQELNDRWINGLDVIIIEKK
jgi:hypothetical protein